MILVYPKLVCTTMLASKVRYENKPASEYTLKASLYFVMTNATGEIRLVTIKLSSREKQEQQQQKWWQPTHLGDAVVCCCNAVC